MEVNSDEKTSNDNIDDTSELLEEEKVSTTDDKEAKAKETGEEKAENFINEESGTADASQITLGDLPDVLEETNENADELGDGINDVDYPIANTDLEHLDSSEIPQLDLYTSSELERQSLEIGDDLLNIVEEDETDEEDDLAYDRDQLLAQYKEALEERSRLQSLNQQCQTQLVEYFKKKKTADEKALEIDKNVTDQEQRYLKYMSNLEELQASEQRQKTAIETQLNELKEKCQEKQSKVEEASDEFEKFKYETGKLSVNSRSGKPIPEKDLENYQATELKKEQEVIAVRLENIKLKNRLKKKEMQLKSKEELAEGLHLIDFEQLKIENQTYNEKIEERNEELLKLRKKITTTVQVLTHLKEKLQFVQGENTEQRLHLKDIDITVAQRRDVLTRIKQVRDALRIDNNKLKHKCGLLGNEALLRDFEDRENERTELTEKLSKLKEAHIQINMNLTTLKKKIEKSK